MNRRKLLCGALGVVPFIAFIPLNTVKSAEIVPERKPDVIKVKWFIDPKLSNDIITYAYGTLWVQGVPVFYERTAWRTGFADGKDLAIQLVTLGMKNAAYSRLGTREYDPVIENSTTDLYLEN